MLESIGVAAVAFMVSLAVSLALIRGVIPSPYAQPSERSLHNQLISRGGGLGIVLAFLAVALFKWANPFFLISVFLLWCVSALDDWRGVGARIRLLFHAFAALILVVGWLPSLG
ncbi:MAG: hypothetical protein ACRDAM_18965, partial [Casimicrobium sp.]